MPANWIACSGSATTKSSSGSCWRYAEAPAWLERRGLLPAIRQLGELRATALELGIEEPGTIERFLLHGLAFPAFQDTPAFLAHMRRPLADSPEQRFQDYERIVEFRLASQKWRAYETSGRPA